MLAIAGLCLLFGGFAFAVLAGTGSDSDGQAQATAQTTASEQPQPKPPPPPAPPKPVAVSVKGVGAFDPEGDGRENDGEAGLATDGDATTFWASERYTSFFKNGVGLLLDAGKPVRLDRVVVRTDTPGIAASVRVGANPEGPFVTVSTTKRLAASTTFQLRPRNARYLLVWIEDIPDGSAAHVNEVRAWRAGTTATS